MLGIAEAARQHGHEYLTFSAPGRSMRQNIFGHAFIGNRYDHNLHLLMGNLIGYHGLFSVAATLRFCRHLDRFRPDCLHLHNLHNSFLNLPLLFRYIRKHRLSVVWTLHDCWAFTGRCPYFDTLGCGKWKNGCGGCPYPKHSYPTAYQDRTASLWRMKKKWFTGMENMTVVTPSHWLANLVGQSFLKRYPVTVIHNGIDLSVFHPVKSCFRQRYSIPEGVYILLGVAFDWGKRKGLDIFIELAKRLDNKFQIVLVGTDEKTDQILPKNILSIHRTQNQHELAEIYSAADVFINPTREDNFPTVNLEALACGIPVVTFNTGGSPEAVDASCGIVVEKDDVFSLEENIRHICEMHPFSTEACVARASCFNQIDRFREYIELYENLGAK